MKRNERIRILAGFLVGAVLMLQASVSMGYQLIQTTQVDTIDFLTNSTAGISFGAYNASVSGVINSNGSVVASGGASGSGNLATGVDGSVGPLDFLQGYTNDVDQYASITSQVVAVPAGDPLTSDVYLLASDENDALGGILTTTSSAYYRQDFSILSNGLLGISALSVANNFFYLDPDEVLPTGLYNYSSFSLWLDGQLIKSISGSRVIDALNDVSGQDYIFNNFIVDNISVTAGQSGYLVLSASNNPVPEPGTFLLLGVGLAGLVAYRRRRAVSA